jgi:hypothetical protein
MQCKYISTYIVGFFVKIKEAQILKIKQNRCTDPLLLEIKCGQCLEYVCFKFYGGAHYVLLITKERTLQNCSHMMPKRFFNLYKQLLQGQQQQLTCCRHKYNSLAYIPSGETQV